MFGDSNPACVCPIAVHGRKPSLHALKRQALRKLECHARFATSYARVIAAVCRPKRLRKGRNSAGKGVYFNGYDARAASVASGLLASGTVYGLLAVLIATFFLPFDIAHLY